MTEQLLNTLVSPSGSPDATLNGAVNNSQLTITVNALPANVTAPNFRIRVTTGTNDEIMLVTGIAGLVLTVTRAVENAAQLPASAHNNGGGVWIIASAGGIAQYVSENAGGGGGAEQGSFGSRPAAGTQGRLYLATDSPILSFDDGAAWDESYAGHPLVDDGFPSTWVNQGGATSDTSKGGVFMAAPAGAGNNLRILDKAAPAAPYSVTLCMKPQVLTVDQAQCGLALRDSSGGGLSLLRLVSVSGLLHIAVTTFSSPTVAVANQVLARIDPADPMYLRIEDDNANRITSWSVDGQHFSQLFSEGRTTFITPDRVGIFVASENASFPAAAWMLGWDEA